MPSPRRGAEDPSSSSGQSLPPILDGKSPADVAVELGISPGAVYAAKSRVRHRCRAEFRDLVA